MEVAPAQVSAPSATPDASGLMRARSALWMILAVALGIRLYLGLTSFCISGDGAAYIGMAKDFAAGDWNRALDAVFSPLYPLLVAGAHRLIRDWELAGNLVSVLIGTAGVAAIYLMVREALGRRDIALGAAALAAIHPELAAYAGSVRTEAGYMCLLVAASWILLRGTNRRAIQDCALAGVIGGVAYLYRTEGVGFLIVGAIFIPATALIWRTTPVRWALGAAIVFAAAFIIVASPYIVWLRATTGHWTVGRELTAAMMYGMADVAAKNREHWRQLGYSVVASPFAVVLAAPRLYLAKVCGDFVGSLYDFVQAMGPLLTVLLAAGLWTRGRRLLAAPAEAFLALMIVFYFCGFALSFTGARFMAHLIPFAFAWIIVGMIASTKLLRRLAERHGLSLPRGAVPAAVALVLLPKTLWPIGYDMRGVRYAGEEIAAVSGGRGAVVARDGRVAFYAGTRFIQLPSRNVGDICSWLESRDGADYLLIGNHDERRLAVSSGASCLDFVKRYRRYGSGYYDLYAVRPSAAERTVGAHG